ncbi:MAG: N-acetylneuraminate synthase family protein [Candidatus Pacebacteria bacterium]|jgi:sialic acid synthase SpsE|nr:N-acetylneuraminate synthase family protein [Candidatus Paceibacterota bacterium]MDP7466450.1 N-acetylneuraminate synthase family protein [Candidatus Paceibacterota bacterium]
MTKIIVEICQNHSGDRKQLEEMIAQAARNGADIVKIQSIYSSDLTKRDRFEEGIIDEKGEQISIKRPYKDEFDRLSKLDLTMDDEAFFIEKCKKYNVTPMTTIFARHRIKEVAALNWPKKIVKVASYDCASLPMLRELAEHFNHFIISTGATYDSEIKNTAKLMKDLGKKFTFLHCVTSYPNTLDMANLSRMEWLRQFAPEVGWSDHTLVERDGIVAAKVAIMLGADFIERHFTILGPKDTKDGPVSITPALLKELSDFRKLSKKEQEKNIEKEYPNWKILLGAPTREMTETELLNRDYYRGRFASPTNDGWIDNWEEKDINK